MTRWSLGVLAQVQYCQEIVQVLLVTVEGVEHILHQTYLEMVETPVSPFVLFWFVHVLALAIHTKIRAMVRIHRKCVLLREFAEPILRLTFLDLKQPFIFHRVEK